jgi:hypothetical protein
VARTVLVAIAIATALVPAGTAQATWQRAAPVARADSPPPASGRPPDAASKSPAGPPLDGGSAAASEAGGDEPEAGSSPGGETDPLVSNGLGSPLCHGALGGDGLSRQSKRNCETSGFIATAAPTGNFGIDVHIDTGPLGLSSGTLLVAVQDVGVTPLWTALVWAVHALVVMLEWCFTIDLLDTASVGGGLARGLRQMQAAFTVPWLAPVFALGAIVTAYNGLIRRRVAETLGRVLLTFAMMVAGTWVMLDPIGTIGALGGWANQASLGTLGVTAHGTPTGAGRTLADSMATVFAAAIETPWCYLEFGDVGWCRNPSRIDPDLRAAGRAIATSELARIGCKGGEAAGACVASSGVEAKALEHSASMLRSAQTNGAIFLALPANGPQRNAINEAGSLLRAICENDNATSCRGSAAAEAEFRTNHGTWGRVAGLVLIVAGLLGLMLLLGCLALRLLASALLSLLYLMLAPMAVLAPALGDGGRAIFRKWAEQLLGAVVSKLLCSFLLGATLAILGILANLEGLGWWTQWLLMSAFWWSAFARRHRATRILGGTVGIEPPQGTRPLTRRVGDAFDPSRKMLDRARAIKERRAKTAPEVVRSPPGSEGGRGAPSHPDGATSVPVGVVPGEQARRVLDAARRDAHAQIELAPRVEARASAMGEQLGRLERARASALVAGDARRAARLATRGERVEGEMRRERRGLEGARRLVAGGEGPEQASGSDGKVSSEQLREHDRFLDAQAALAPATVTRGTRGGKRDYAALAGLAGYGPRAYEQLAPREQRAARARIDRELALRSEHSNLADGSRPGDAGKHPNTQESGTRTDPGQRREVWRGSRARRPETARPSESRVMREAREVADRRKRQLGSDRP